MPAFGANDQIFFRAAEAGARFLFGIREDGTGRRKLSEGGVIIVPAVIPLR